MFLGELHRERTLITKELKGTASNFAVPFNTHISVSSLSLTFGSRLTAFPNHLASLLSFNQSLITLTKPILNLT